jgi:hypothetical protein
VTFGLYLLLNLVFLLFFGWWLRRLIVRRLEPERILSDLEQEVQRIIQDLNAAGDQNVTLLEDRISGLRTLLQRADTQIDELDYKLRALEENRDHRPDLSAYGEDEESGQATSTAGPAAGPGMAPGTGPAAEPPGEGEPPLVIPFRRDIPGGEDVPADNRQRVLMLHGQGLSSDLIASRTGMAIGEVELIISLGMKRTRQ